MAGITDKEVRALISKAQREGKALYQADGFVPGLTLSASKTGVASWYLRFRWAGKQKEVTIGQYPGALLTPERKPRNCAGLLILALMWLSKNR